MIQAPTIAVAMIVKNEEAMLERCLNSVIGADSIYILDTGSQDRTIEIARKYTDKVFLDFIWIDSFCKAQNHIKSKVKEDWILSIDADEVLTCDWSEVQKAVSLASEDMVRVTMMGEGELNTFGFGRLFRNKPDVYWEQDIHKHLNVPGEGENVGNVSIVYGHSPAHDLDPDRSLRILERTVQEEENPVRNLYYLGREYWYKKRYQDAISTLERYLKVGHWAAEMAEANLIIAQAYLELRQIEPCASACLQAIKLNSNFKEAIQLMAEISINENRKQWERMAKTANNQNLVWVRTQVEPQWNSIFLAPHNDDESLFGAFTLMREKPLVIIVTDSYIQPERGEVGCDAETRRQETIEAMKIAGCPVVFLGIKDTELTVDLLFMRLKSFHPETVYAPATQGGNLQHDIVGRVAKKLFGAKCKFYTTYTKTDLHTTGTIEVKPTQEEVRKKFFMLGCYKSQLALKSTRPHLEAVLDKSEWLKSPFKKIMITPYFGHFPEWMDKFTLPPEYDLLLDVDLEQFKKRVKQKLGIDYPGEFGTGKVWDFRPALGLLYEDEIKEYDFWGTCDFDMVFGDVDKWFDDETLSKLDIWSNHHDYICGPWTLYRNCELVNKLFMQHPQWKEKLLTVEPNGWVENEFSRVAEQSVRLKYSFHQGNPYEPPFNLKKVDGKLFQDGNEIAMLHFRHDKRWPL